jgi:RHS repeat-associated protein
VAIAYPGQSGKATAFAYDVLGRRLTITSTPAGGSAVATNYLWCGSAICQARNSSNSATRAYYDEGEYSPGASPQSIYYGVDQIGSTRRAFVSSTNAPAYTYDPWGNELSGTAKVADFGFAKLFNNADSSLNLATYRVFDPSVGRCLSRDPLGEDTDPSYNLYAYAQGDPVGKNDPTGLAPTCEGFGGGCQSGGTYGTTGMYCISGRNVCRQCAIKLIGIENLSSSEQMKILAPFLRYKYEDI